MDQGSYRNEKKRESISNQGRYGEKYTPAKLKRWICPNCETVNAEYQCRICGMQQPTNENVVYIATTRTQKKKFSMRIIVTIAVLLVLSVGVTIFVGGKVNSKQDIEPAVINEPTIETGSVVSAESKSEVIAESKYRQARIYWEHHVYDTAHNLLSELSGYMDADSLLSELEVEWAVYCLENNDMVRMASFGSRVTLDEEESSLIYDAILRAPTAPPVWLLDKLVGELPQLDTMKELCGILSITIEPLKNLQSHRQLLEEFWDFPMVQDYIETNFQELLWGSWKAKDGEYINFTYERYGIPESSLPEPQLPPEQRAYCTLGKAYSLGPDLDTENMVVIFRFELLDLDTMEVWCSENGKTYTMYRKK